MRSPKCYVCVVLAVVIAPLLLLVAVLLPDVVVSALFTLYEPYVQTAMQPALLPPWLGRAMLAIAGTAWSLVLALGVCPQKCKKQ